MPETADKITTTKITVQNINTPGRTTRVDRAKYEAMRTALMAVLPIGAPGLTVKDALTRLKPHLSADHFPQGATAGWWQKTVQLDLEAKGRIAREPTRPMQIHRTE